MLDAIGVVVKDMKKSVKFYELLGLNFSAVGGEDHYEAKLDNGLRVMLDSEKLIKELNPSWENSSHSSVIICFKQSNSKNVDDIFEKLVDAGGSSIREPWDAFWGQRYASVKDLDGNQLDIFADL